MTTPVEPRAAATPSPDSLPAVAPPAGQAPRPWVLLALGTAGMLAGAAMVMLLKSPVNNVSAAAVSTTAVAANAAVRSETPSAVITPRWSGGVRRSNGHNVAVYELQADNDVAVWGKVVRPVLTVRCIAGTTEVFVLTQSAAAIDGNDGRHAVRVGFDTEPDGAERWMASDEYDALFAENGVGAARRIASARTMRFGFTPYNGSPVVASFQVAGFDTLAPKLARSCRWK